MLPTPRHHVRLRKPRTGKEASSEWHGWPLGMRRAAVATMRIADPAAWATGRGAAAPYAAFPRPMPARTPGALRASQRQRLRAVLGACRFATHPRPTQQSRAGLSTVPTVSSKAALARGGVVIT